MYLKCSVPEVQKCCFCVPLRSGIIILAYINIIFSVLSIACLVVTTELRRATLTHDQRLDAMTSTVLFSILGMGVLLNILLLFAGCQKDESMLRLYSYYAVATMLAALVPTCILLARDQYVDVAAALLAIVTQCYVVVVVRSEVLVLEKRRLGDQAPRTAEEVVAVPEHETLL
ncbi:uncharacterized protein LOC105386314 [Plutella xylostella]|uniref:uncharacterized protein LOC105386314 n=1 Tax=Plutella xylostella TaxID=51655 RepID=UPI0005D05309|nr:uncharacterized protein LOC105386314 [Plutella xylostella]